MRSIVESIYNSINEKAIPAITKYTDDEPKSDKEKYVRARFMDKWYEEVADAIFVKFEDIPDTTKTGVWTEFYNLGKKLSNKTIEVEISTWEEDGWTQFANAALQNKARMWHPEWISIEHPFK